MSRTRNKVVPVTRTFLDQVAAFSGGGSARLEAERKRVRELLLAIVASDAFRFVNVADVSEESP